MPGAGELFVLWDGDGLVVKRVEPVHEPDRGAPKLRLLSANPDYPAYTCRADEIHIVGKVLWKVTRAQDTRPAPSDSAGAGPRRPRRGARRRTPTTGACRAASARSHRRSPPRAASR